MDTPLLQEVACGCGGELRATICGNFVRDAEGGRGASQAVYESLRSLLCSLNNGSVEVAVYNDKIADP